MNSGEGQTSQGGWFDEGTEVTVSTSSPQIVQSDRTRLVFQQWKGDLDSKSETIRVKMDSPKTISAVWKRQHSVHVDAAEGEVMGTSGWVDEGGSVTLQAVTPFKTIEGHSRLLFAGWMDDVSSANERIAFTVDRPFSIMANWKTQYYVKVTSQIGVVQGEGWYDAGSSATISVVEPAGLLVRDVFMGWTGDITSREPTVSVKVNAPKTIEATWGKNYTQLILLIATVAAGIIAMLFVRRRRPLGLGCP